MNNEYRHREYRHRVVDTANDDVTQQQDHTGPGHGSAMVVVLGLVALLSLFTGILIGLLL
jgi:hypothetical protein